MITPYLPSGSSMQGSDTGEATRTADGNNDTFIIPHGLPVTPRYANAVAGNFNTIGGISVTWDSENITIMYATPPAPGQLEFTWIAIR